LVERHYDPSYEKYAKRHLHAKLGSLVVDPLSAASQEDVAADIVRLMGGLQGTFQCALHETA